MCIWEYNNAIAETSDPCEKWIAAAFLAEVILLKRCIKQNIIGNLKKKKKVQEKQKHAELFIARSPYFPRKTI